MPSLLHSHLFHRSHSFSSLAHLTKSKSESTTTLNRSASDMRKSRPSSPLPAPSQPLPFPRSQTQTQTQTPAAPPPPPSASNSASTTTSDMEKDKDKDKETVVRPKHKRIFSLTRQTPDPVPLHGSADKEISSKNGKDIDLPPRTSTSLPTTPTSKAPSPSAAPNTAAHAPTLALLNGEGQTHRHSSSLPANSITVNPPPAPTPVTTFAPSPTPALSKTPSPESQPPSARSSTIVVHSPPPSIPSHLSVAAEDVSRRSSFRHMFRRTSKDHNKKRDTPSKSKHCHGKGDVHSSRDAFSDGDDCAHMSPASLDSSIDYESAFKAVMLENIKLREEMAELRRRSSLPLAVDGHHEHYHHHLESREGQDTKGLALGLGQGTRPTPDLEQSVRELTTAIRAVPGRILIIVLIAGFVAIFKSWKFETCVYVV